MGDKMWPDTKIGEHENGEAIYARDLIEKNEILRNALEEIVRGYFPSQWAALGAHKSIAQAALRRTSNSQ